MTLLPASASEEARLIAVVVLPSDGDGLVTRIDVERASWRREADSVAPSVRYASIVDGESDSGASAPAPCARASFGMRARIGRPYSRRSCSSRRSRGASAWGGDAPPR